MHYFAAIECACEQISYFIMIAFCTHGLVHNTSSRLSVLLRMNSKQMHGLT